MNWQFGTSERKLGRTGTLHDALTAYPQITAALLIGPRGWEDFMFIGRIACTALMRPIPTDVGRSGVDSVCLLVTTEPIEMSSLWPVEP